MDLTLKTLKRYSNYFLTVLKVPKKSPINNYRAFVVLNVEVILA